ncbi:hypothetical protein JCM3765_002569 [Sporobolomyces pararoseus]
MQQSSSSSDESASPNLSSSPLQSMSGISSALPASQTNGFARDNSYGSNGSGGEADLPVDNEEAYNEHEEENEALRKYREQMHSYIASRFASFKTDLEQKTRAEGSSMPPSGLPQRRNNNH